MSPIHLQNLILHKVSSTLCISSLLHFPLNSTLRMLEIREKLEWLDRATLLHLFLSPSLRCWLPSTVSWQHPAVQMALLIISGHCYRHPCSSHWPPAGDAGLFCCSTCGRPAAQARGSKGMLRSPPAPGQTPAGRGARTSPRRATTSLLQTLLNQLLSVFRWYGMSSSHESNQSSDNIRRRSWLLNARRVKSQVMLCERHKRQELHAASSSELLPLTFKRRGGGCYDNTPAYGGEDGGSGRETYITIIIFCWGGGGLQMSVDARRLAARCVKSIPLHLTARPSHSLCDIEKERGDFCVSCTSNICSDWRRLQGFM